MSARVLNPMMMTEMSRVISAGGVVGGRVAPARAALARVRRDLFGPVDHAAARALVERELGAQAVLDAERWGFDFKLGKPKPPSPGSQQRYEWEPVTAADCVPEPYALRGMPYIRKHSPPTPRKLARAMRMPRPVLEESPVAQLSLLEAASLTPNGKLQQQVTERTPPQEARVPLIGETTPDVVPKLGELSVCSAEKPPREQQQQPTTPVLQGKKLQQPAITNFMKSRKRALSGASKSLTEPPEKVSRSAGQIR